MSTLQINNISAQSGNTVTFKSHLFVDIGGVSFELTPQRIAAINAELFAGLAQTARDEAVAAAAQAVQARNEAIAAAEASGDVLFFDTYADLTAALPLPDLQVVEVFVDETRDDERTRYRIEGGSPVFKLELGAISDEVLQSLFRVYLTYDALVADTEFTSKNGSYGLVLFGGGLSGSRVYQSSGLGIPPIDLGVIDPGTISEERLRSFFNVISQNSALVSYRSYIINNTLQNLQLTLPVSPSTGDLIHLYPNGNTQNNWTIVRNGQNIQRIAEDLIVDDQNINFSLIYVNPTVGWAIV